MEWESDSLCHSHTYPRQERWSPGRLNRCELGFRDCGAIPGWGLLLTAERWIEGMWGRRDRLRGYKGGDRDGKSLWGKGRQPWKQGNTAESRGGGGAITIASFSPQASISSWTIERLAHHMPDALNYRVGPHPGCPLNCLTRWSIVGPQPEGPSMCLTHQTTEKDPRQGSPLSAWMGKATGKDWPKRPSDHQLQEARKKTLIGP